MTEQQAPIAKAQMLIRKPAAQVFEALIDPAITCKFWFTHGSGRLEVGKQVRWAWAMYGPAAVADVVVKAIEPNQRILVEWGGYGAMQPIEWTLTPKSDTTTLLQVRNWGFAPHQIAEVIDSTEGFTLVLAGLKAWLEYGIALNLTADHNPDAIVKGDE